MQWRFLCSESRSTALEPVPAKVLMRDKSQAQNRKTGSVSTLESGRLLALAYLTQPLPSNRDLESSAIIDCPRTGRQVTIVLCRRDSLRLWRIQEVVCCFLEYVSLIHHVIRDCLENERCIRYILGALQVGVLLTIEPERRLLTLSLTNTSMYRTCHVRRHYLCFRSILSGWRRKYYHEPCGTNENNLAGTPLASEDGRCRHKNYQPPNPCGKFAYGTCLFVAATKLPQQVIPREFQQFVSPSTQVVEK